MVEELGGYLEELAKDYLVIVEGYNLAEIEASRSLKQSTSHRATTETTAPSDIEVAGVKGKVLMIVSCRERPGGAEDWKDDVERIKRARKAKDLQDFRVQYSMAYANYPKESVRNDFRQFFKVQGVRVLFLDEMAEELLMKTDG